MDLVFREQREMKTPVSTMDAFHLILCSHLGTLLPFVVKMSITEKFVFVMGFSCLSVIYTVYDMHIM